MIFSQKTTDFVWSKCSFHTQNDIERVMRTCTLKMWRWFFPISFLKMADFEKQTLSELFSLFYSYDARLFMKMYIQGYLRALIINLLPDLQISKWRMKYNRKNLLKIPIFFWKNRYIRIFRGTDYKSAIRLGKSKMAVQCNGQNFEKTPIF